MSDISIPDCLSDLLFENGQVVLPGIGFFQTKFSDVNVDPVQGVIRPPSKEVTFNANITADDGVLTEFIKKKYGADDLAARTALASFTNDLRLRMHKKEIITIPEVGRLYIDFERNLQFLPDRMNYNKDSFGLPSLNYFPTIQEASTASSTNEVEATQPTIEPKPDSEPDSAPQNQPSKPTNIPVPPLSPGVSDKNQTQPTVIPVPPEISGTGSNEDWSLTRLLNTILPVVLILSIGLVGYVFYDWYTNNYSQNSEGTDQLAGIEGRVNKKPSYSDDTKAVFENDNNATPPLSEEEIIYDDFDNNEPESSNESDNALTGEDEIKPQMPGSQKRGIIIVGGFSSARNAQKLVQKIQRKGFNPYTDAKGPLTRVGVEFEYSSVSDLDDMHRQIKREFNDRAWILEPR